MRDLTVTPVKGPRVVQPDDPKLRLRLDRALNRIGREPARRLGWLLKLADEDIDAVSPGRLVDLSDEIEAFVYTKDVAGDVAYRSSDWHDEDVVRSVQRTFKALMDDLFQKGQCHYDAESRFFLFRNQPGEPIEQALGTTTEIKFVLAAFELFTSEGHRIRNCAEPKCNRLFVATKRQAFCSPQCSQRVRTAKYRKAHREVAQRLRRATYVKKQRAKHGLTVRVASRKKT
jgi:hypothetical protein